MGRNLILRVRQPPQPDGLGGAGLTQERPTIPELGQRLLVRPRPRPHPPAAAVRRVRRRHLSPAARAALAHTHGLHIDLGDLLWLGLATAPSGHDETPVRLHPIRATVPRISLGVDALVAVAPPGRAIVHPSLRELGDRAAAYVRARRWWRRWYLTRQLAYGLLIVGVIAATPILALGARDATAAARGLDVRYQHAGAPATATRVAQPDIATGTSAPSRAAPGAHASASSTGFHGMWVTGIHGRWFVPYPADPNTPFLRCTRAYESDTAGGYDAVDRSYRHFGAYQFLQSTWNTVARHAGQTALVGVNPAVATDRDQDWMALYLYRWLGASHWQYRCSGM